MKIKYPKSELFVVIGSKNFAMYTTASSKSVMKLLQKSDSKEFLDFEIAVQKTYSINLWYPDCGAELFWLNWTIKKSAIKSFVAMPKPKLRVDYSDNDKAEHLDF